MKLATPLTITAEQESYWRMAHEKFYTDVDLQSESARHAWAELDAIRADHARLTADLADAVAALKDIEQEARIIIDAECYPETGTPRNIDIDCANIILKRARALVARVEART